MQLIIYMIPLREQDKHKNNQKVQMREKLKECEVEIAWEESHHKKRKGYPMWGSGRPSRLWCDISSWERTAKTSPVRSEVMLRSATDSKVNDGARIGKDTEKYHFFCNNQGWLHQIHSMWGASWISGWPVDPPCTPGPLRTSGLALNFREHVASCIEISQICSISLSVP